LRVSRLRLAAAAQAVEFAVNRGPYPQGDELGEARDVPAGLPVDHVTHLDGRVHERIRPGIVWFAEGCSARLQSVQPLADRVRLTLYRLSQTTDDSVVLLQELCQSLRPEPPRVSRPCEDVGRAPQLAEQTDCLSHIQLGIDGCTILSQCCLPSSTAKPGGQAA
jgi:hypothetical protein